MTRLQRAALRMLSWIRSAQPCSVCNRAGEHDPESPCAELEAALSAADQDRSEDAEAVRRTTL